MATTPRVFVGASSEANEAERLVHDVLEHVGIKPIPWRHSFRPGEYGLDSFERIARQAYGAILIASADDKTWYRGLESFSPRDNVLFELGYFLQAFGRRRTAIVQVENELGAVPRIPTDLAGLTVIRFREGMDVENRRKIENWADFLRKSFRLIHPNVSEAVRLLREEYLKVDPDWEVPIADLVLTPFLRSLRAALLGEILLTPGQYYNRLNAEIVGAASGSEILAVSTISSRTWSSDRDQQDYFNRNIDAAARGVRIRRLFVLPEDMTVGLENLIRLQDQSGILVRIADPQHGAYSSTLEDIVVFINSDTTARIRGYIALPAFDNPGRLRAGKLLLDVNQCEHQREAFESAWTFAVAPRELGWRYRTPDQQPPGLIMESFWLGSPVISCQDAAAARGVPLKNELKSLIVETSKGLIAAHVPGDRKLSLRRVKDVLEIERATLVSLENLRAIDLSPGTVSAVLEPVWSLPHLIDRAVMELEFVTTNNRKTTGYFRFDPKLLLTAPSYTLADISVPNGHADAI